eukprot:730-Chlamydomonas_euryale.AAC.2
MCRAAPVMLRNYAPVSSRLGAYWALYGLFTPFIPRQPPHVRGAEASGGGVDWRMAPLNPLDG